MRATGIEVLDSHFSAMMEGRWIRAESLLRAYGDSESHHGGTLPDRVARVVAVAELQEIMRLAHAERVPVTARGAGTSLEGNALAVQGGILLDLSGMNRIMEVRAEDLLAVVEPGVTREQLNRDLRETGLFFPVDPGADATLGGMVSTRASGTNAVRYGTMRENVLALDVVLADGTLIHTGSRARKSAAGYDLTHLFVGAEGTLGIVTGVTLRLHGQPECVVSGVRPFMTLQGAVDTVIAAVQMGVPVARLELLDAMAIHACNGWANLSLPEQPTLFIELHGSPAAVAEQQALLDAIGAEHGGGVSHMSSDEDRRRALWRARHAALPAARGLRPGAKIWSTDVCVPVSHLGEAILQAQEAIATEGLVAPILGHVGDGNFHILFVLTPGDAAMLASAERVNEAVIAHALAVGGTCTGEHGIGLGKRQALVKEHGSESVEVMRRIKAVLDPRLILNPGKIFV